MVFYLVKDIGVIQKNENDTLDTRIKEGMNMKKLKLKIASLKSAIMKKFERIQKSRKETSPKKRLAQVVASIAVIAIIATALTVTIQEVYAISKFEEEVNSRREKIEKINKEIQEIDEEITFYSEAEIWNMDLSKPSGITPEELAPMLRGGTIGLEEAFIEAEEKYGVNAIFLVSIAALESAWGTINFRENNMFGYGSSGYDTKEENIMVVAEGLGNNYLSSEGVYYSGVTASDVNVRYATSTTWDDKVIYQMSLLYEEWAEMQVENVKKEKEEKQNEIAALEAEIMELEKQEEERKFGTVK